MLVLEYELCIDSVDVLGQCATWGVTGVAALFCVAVVTSTHDLGFLHSCVGEVGITFLWLLLMWCRFIMAVICSIYALLARSAIVVGAFLKFLIFELLELPPPLQM